MRLSCRPGRSILSVFAFCLLSAVTAYGQSATGLGHSPYRSKPMFAAPKPMFAAEVLPAKFDLRTEGRLTPVKDQGEIGSCWTFATYASLESTAKSLIALSDDDFSEQNMKNSHGFASGHNDGGTAQMSLGYLARWGGPVPEALDPYKNDLSKSTSPKIPPASMKVKIDEILFIPDKDLTAVKKTVMKYGAIYSGVCWEDGNGYYNEKTAAHFAKGATEGNHAIAIVGWDDAYPRKNFLIAPSRDGAFIVKNSWGTGFGDKGFLYVSYDDPIIATDNACFVGSSDSKFNRIYQLDACGPVSWLNFSAAKDAWYAAVFSAAAEEDLQAVGVFTRDENEEFEVYVQQGFSGGAPAFSGKPAAEGTSRYPGYRIVRLKEAIPLKAKEKFAVGIRTRSPGSVPHIPVEEVALGYVSKVDSKPNASYYKAGGGGWTDLAKSRKGNIVLKAFTTVRSADDKIAVSQLKFSSANIHLAVGDTIKLETSVLPKNATDKALDYLVDKKDASRLAIGADGSVTAKAVGTVTVTVATRDRKITDTCTIVIDAKPAVPAAVADFEDPELENAVRSQLGKKKGTVTLKEAALITRLSVDSAALYSLKGIAALSGLAELSVESTSLTDIAPLSGCAGLKVLSLAGNRIADLSPLSKLSGLTSLSLKGNPVSKLDALAALSKLERLDLSATGVKRLAPLSRLANLSSLDLSGNGLSDISPIASLGALRKLNLSSNAVKDVSVLKRSVNLTALFLEGNPITDYSPLSAVFPKLTEKDFELGDAGSPDLGNPALDAILAKALGKKAGAKITAAELKSITLLDLNELGARKGINLRGIEKLPNLTELSAYDLGIVDLAPLSRLAALEYLDLADNAIVDLAPLKGLTALACLDLGGNRIANVAPLSGLTDLEELYLNDNYIAEVSALSGLKNLYVLDLSANRISDIKALGKLENLEALDLSSNSISKIAPLSELENLASLFLAENKIQDYASLRGMYDYLAEYDFDLSGRTFDPVLIEADEYAEGQDYIDDDMIEEFDDEDFEDFGVFFDEDAEDEEFIEDDEFIEDEEFIEDGEGEDWLDDEEFGEDEGE